MHHYIFIGIIIWLALGKLGRYFLLRIYYREIAPQFRCDEDQRLPWWFYLIMPLFLPLAMWDYLYPQSYRRVVSSDAYTKEMEKYKSS